MRSKSIMAPAGLGLRPNGIRMKQSGCTCTSIAEEIISQMTGNGNYNAGSEEIRLTLQLQSRLRLFSCFGFLLPPGSVQSSGGSALHTFLQRRLLPTLRWRSGVACVSPDYRIACI